jgi:alkylation response protein AidB-like acyl-CoA dehydrogenase
MATHVVESGIDTIEAARSLQPELRERADEIEQARRLPAELARRLAEAGFNRLCVPKVYGGLEAPPAITARSIELLAQADASVAWCAFIGATSGSVLALIPEEAAREVFATPETLVGGVFAPNGRAEVEEGGFRVNGRWQWGSGTENADWILGGCQIVRDGEVERLPSGAPRTHMMLAPRAEVKHLDTWYVSGLCGTGSTDFVMEDIHVPERRAVGLQGLVVQSPLYAFPHFGLLGMSIAAVSMGLARAAIDELVEFAGAKTPVGSVRTLAKRAAAQSDVAEAEALLRSARSWFYEVLDCTWEVACREGTIAVEDRRDVRLATTHAVRSCARAVDLMYNLGGGTSVYRRSPLQRIFRDMHVATQHAMVAPGTLELTGRLFLGLETDTSML